MSLDPMPSARALRAMAVRKGVVIEQNAAKEPRSASVRPWHPFRSKWEADYAMHLDVLKATNRIWDWDYEPDKLDIGVGAVFTPDFKVFVTFSGAVEYHEVKGYRRESAIVRIKVAAKQYPQYRFVLVTKKRGQWHHTPVREAAT